MSTAFDPGSLDMLCDLGIRRIKVPSGELTNTVYLKACAAKGLPVILSTGMADLAEVEQAVGVLQGEPRFAAVAAPDRLTILHCTSAYPTMFADANLLAMTTMGNALGVPVGLSDHTVGIAAAPIAVAMGACMIEKHITLDRTLPGPDHFASIEPDEFAAMMRAIADVEVLRGDGVKRPREAELEARALVRRGLKAARAMDAGTVLSSADIALLRPATGLAPAQFEAALGRTLMRALSEGDPITAADLS
jgi:sialic acid synthase SpsE